MGEYMSYRRVLFVVMLFFQVSAFAQDDGEIVMPPDWNGSNNGPIDTGPADDGYYNNGDGGGSEDGMECHSIQGGKASYYNLPGHNTAEGIPYKSKGMYAAHKTLPMGSIVRVTIGGKSIFVTINDRGPFVGGRVIDLNLGAARAIGLVDKGVAQAKLELCR
jgi:hypothetical protein